MAALLGGLGLAHLTSSLHNDNEKDNSFTASCETKVQLEGKASSSEAVEEPKKLFEIIPPEETSVNDDDGSFKKSERAFASAMENSLFATYIDGADNYEVDEKGGSSAGDATPGSGRDCGDTETNDNSNDDAVHTEHFVSFSAPASTVVNVKPRVSLRHTNRRAASTHLATSERGYARDGDYPTIISDDEEGAAKLTPDQRKANRKAAVKRINTMQSKEIGKDQVYTKNVYFYQSPGVKEYMLRKFRLFALPSSQKLGKEMAFLLDTSLNCIDVGAFADGETAVQVGDNVRGKEVFVVCSTTSSKSIIELLLTITALRRGSAKRICAVIPYYGYSRQDRRSIMLRVSFPGIG